MRTHNILRSLNQLSNVKVYGITRYGYPHDKPNNYYGGKVNENVYVKEEVEYIKLLNGNDNFNTNNIIDYIEKYKNELKKVVKELNINIIHAASNWWNGIVALEVGNELEIHSVYELRGLWDESVLAYRPEILGSDMQELKKKMEEYVIKNVDSALTINNNLQKEISIRTGLRAKVIPNGVDINKFKPNNDNKHILRKELEIKTDIVIGYIGSVLNYEGIDIILEAIMDMKVTFILIGKGKELTNILSKAKELGTRMIHIESLDNDDVPKYYDLFDIVVYPRRNIKVCQTTISSKVFEAMAMSKPLIVSNLPAYNEIIYDEKNGLICNPESKELQININKLIESKELRERLGKNAREWVKANSDWSSIAKKIEEIYERL